jgi:hypothetical protein
VHAVLTLFASYFAAVRYLIIIPLGVETCRRMITDSLGVFPLNAVFGFLDFFDIPLLLK